MVSKKLMAAGRPGPNPAERPEHHRSRVGERPQWGPALLLTVLLILSAVPALADGVKKTVTFAADPNWPPLEFVENNQVVGYSVDYFTAVCREMGREAVFVKADWDSIFDRLNAGDYDAVMSSVTITAERRQAMDFTIPYYIVRQSLLVGQDSPLANIRQLKDKRVGTQADTTATGIVEKIPGVTSKTYPDIESAIRALAAGELDAVVCEDVVASAFLKDPTLSGKIRMASVVETPGAEELYGVAVRKDNFDMLVLLNDGIKAVKAKGIENDLRRKWITGAN